MNIKKINELMSIKNITRYRLRKITGLHETQIANILNGKTKDLRISTVKAIAKALEVDINEII